MLGRISGRKMNVLTLAPDFDPRMRERELLADGYINRHVRIRNIWTELRSASDRTIRAISGPQTQASVDDSQRTPLTGAEDYEKRSPTGDLLQVARYRSDGTLLLTDRHDVKTEGRPGGRRLTLYTRKGAAAGTWKNATSFYHAWLKHVTRRPDSIIICDSAFTGGLMHSFTSDTTRLIQAIHSHHRHSSGTLSATKFSILSNAEKYDRIVLLTHRQHDDMSDEGMGLENFSVIPNPFSGLVSPPVSHRPRQNGTIIARLAPVKRLDHALKAIAGTSTAPAPKLDIYGDGPDSDQLQRLIDDLSLTERVQLHGHTPNAREQFAEASFCLLTSDSEGHPLVLVESMAGGCIPIAYDIDYGPSDIITHGVDGLLVPPGDIDALAETIQAFLSMPEPDVAEMRRAAIETSRTFSPENIAKEWSAVFTQTRSSRKPVSHDGKRIRCDIAEMDIRGESLSLRIRIHELDLTEVAWAKLAWVGRKKDAYFRASAALSKDADGCYVSGTVSAQNLTLGSSGFIDLFVDLGVENVRHRSRVASGASSLPAQLGRLEVYETAHGNVSIRLPKEI